MRINIKTLQLGGLALTAGLAVACGGGKGIDVTEFMGYGSGQPGAALTKDGGEILLERIKLNVGMGATEYSTFHAYHFQGIENLAKRPDVVNGGCLQLEAGDGWPTNVIPDTAQYVDWGDSITLRAKDGSWTKSVPKVVEANPGEGLLDNRPNFNRKHPFLYGGPTWQADNLAASDYQNNATYEVEVEKINRTFEIVFPPAHTAPFGIGTADAAVEVPVGQDWKIDWPAVEQVEGETHTRAHHFTFIAFAKAVEGKGPIAVMICPATERGTITLKAEDVATLPESGIIQHGRLTHFMEELDGARFDLMAIDCTIGTYKKMM